MNDFKAIYDGFNKAVAEGKLEDGIKLRTEETRKSFDEYTKTPEDKAGTIQMLQAMIPLSAKVDHVDEKEGKAVVYMTGVFKDPENAEKTVTQGMMVNFAKEGADWKMADVMYMADPNDIKKSPDDNFEPKENYDLDSNTSMGGPIREVKFEKDYTLVKVKMLDEEDLVYLPNKEELEKTGLKTSDLVEYKILSVSGFKHKSNPLKIWGEKAEIVEAA